MNKSFDIAIVGSGFAGSLLAMIARRLGRSVALIERGRHPRFVIGESSTPLANLLLEELAQRYDLPRVASLSKWGAWQRRHPQIGCGLKRGFTFYHHEFGRAFEPRPDHANELLVAASPHDEIADTHWYRPDFDYLLVQEAQTCGVEYLDEVALQRASFDAIAVFLEGERHDQPFSIRAQFVVDATGPRGFLHRTLELPESPFEHLPGTQGLYSHFHDVERFEEIRGMDQPPAGEAGQAIPIRCHDSMTRTSPLGPREKPVRLEEVAAPYPPDAAALHHVFEGGWIWVLRFNNGITSAGAAVTDSLARDLNLREGRSAWHRLLDRLPSVRTQFADANPVLPFVHSPRLSFCSPVVAGARWALLPSAAGFLDPLLSTGFPLTLLGVGRLARAIEETWGTSGFDARLASYEQITTSELLAAERLIAALYSNMNDFPTFTALSLLYFAAASFSETARRLGRSNLAPSFLLHDQPQFGPSLRGCCDLALRAGDGGRLSQADRSELQRQVANAIAPIDVAGLSDRTRRNWYPARAEDLLGAASKLGVERTAIERLLVRCGFVVPQRTSG